MKVEKREIAQPKPPCEIVVTMSETEARDIASAIWYYRDNSGLFRSNQSSKNSYAGDLRRFAESIENAL